MNNERFPGLSSPANDTLQRSLYIAALDRYLGIRGLISPVVDEEAGLDYDFFFPASGTVIKVFKNIDQKTVARYEEGRRDRSIFIVDAVALETQTCDECGEAHPDLESDILQAAVLVLDAYLYMDDELFIFDPDGCEWDPIMPVERRRCLEAIDNIDYE